MKSCETLFSGHQDIVKPEWIDINGHMNVAYYILAFDSASDEFLKEIGWSEAYLKSENNSFFVVEMNTSYKQELHLQDPISCTTQLIASSDKKIHLYHRMYHKIEGYLAATNEILLLHIDMDVRRSAPMGESFCAQLTHIKEKQKDVTQPDNLSRVFTV